MSSSRSSRAQRRDGRSERWREHREARRQELIAAVMTVVSEQGAGVGMDDIARASHIAKPVFYRYFRDKAELFVEVGRAVGETVVAETTAAIDAAPIASIEAGGRHRRLPGQHRVPARVVPFRAPAPGSGRLRHHRGPARHSGDRRLHAAGRAGLRGGRVVGIRNRRLGPSCGRSLARGADDEPCRSGALSDGPHLARAGGDAGGQFRAIDSI